MSSLSGLSMAQEEDEHSLEAKFAAAVKVIRSLPEEGPFQPSDDLMLMFYSYYKQATVGPCNVPRPMGFWGNRGKVEWDAWCSLGNMTKEEAMKNYIEDIQLILETIPISDDVSALVQKLGNFYTEVESAEEEGNEVGKRFFTRPFAGQEEELIRSIKKPILEGYGGLWDDIQNVQEQDKHSSVLALSFSSEEAEASRESSQIERKEESGDWRRSEEDEDAIGDDEDEKERDWSPDPRFLMVDDGRFDSKGSNSSVEPSMSSFTNGTHSSLNSEVEEEELACSLEPSVQFNPYMYFNGHFSDHSDAAPDSNHRSADSDNEEFCDSMEHLAMEELSMSKGLLSAGSGTASVMPSELWFESSTTLKEAEDEGLTWDFCLHDVASPNKLNSSLSGRERGSLSPQAACSSLRCLSVNAACGCLPQSRHPVRGNVSEQIATALLRLQGDMADVLQRLHSLEELTKSQSRSSSPRQEDLSPLARKFLRPSWWPFDSSPLTVVVTALWPLIAHLLVQLYLKRKRRKAP